MGSLLPLVAQSFPSDCRLRVCHQMAERSLLMKADGDVRAGTCGKRWAIFRLKSAAF